MLEIILPSSVSFFYLLSQNLELWYITSVIGTSSISKSDHICRKPTYKPFIYLITNKFNKCIAEKRSNGRTRVDPEADNQQLTQLEEKDVVSSVATVLSDLCGPGEWMPMEKLYSRVSFCMIFGISD